MLEYAHLFPVFKKKLCMANTLSPQAMQKIHRKIKIILPKLNFDQYDPLSNIREVAKASTQIIV